MIITYLVFKLFLAAESQLMVCKTKYLEILQKTTDT